MKLETAEDVKAALKACDKPYTEANKNLAFKCVERAKWLKDADLEFEARNTFISQAFFLNHNEESIPMFAKQLHYIDNNDVGFVKKLTLLWSYKWIVNSLYTFSGIPLEKVESIFADFERRFNESGMSGNAISDFRRRLAFGLGKPDKALEIYREMDETVRSRMLDDCEACQINTSLNLLIYHGLYDEINKAVKPILDGDLTCENVPKTTYPKLTYLHYLRGEWDLAEKYDSETKKHLDEEHFRTASFRLLLPFWGVSRKFIRGLDTITHQMTFMTPKVSALTKFRFFHACSLFFRAMHQQGDLWVSLDTNNLEEQSLLDRNADGQLNTVSLEKVFLLMAEVRAKKLDERNGNQFYGSQLEKETSILDRQLKAYLNR